MQTAILDFFSQVFNYLKNLKKAKLKDVFNDWNIYEIAWLFLSTIILACISFITADKYLTLTLVATVTGMLNLVLIAKGKILNYFFAFIYNLTYAYFCLLEGIYGQAILFIFFFFPMQFYGLYCWTKPESTDTNSTIVTKSLSLKQQIILAISVIILAFLYGVFILKAFFHQEIGLVADSLTGVISVIAIFLMVKAYIEQWILWIIINVLSTIIWIQQYYTGTDSGGIAFLAMWLIYLLNSIYGYINWIKLQKNQN